MDYDIVDINNCILCRLWYILTVAMGIVFPVGLSTLHHENMPFYIIILHY